MISLYVPGDSPIHRLPAGAALLGLLVFSLVSSLYPHGPISALVVLALVVGCFAVAGLAGTELLRQLWRTRWIIVFLVVSQLLFLTPEDAFVNTTRVVAIVLLAGLVTATTRTEDTIDALTAAARPLRPLGVDPRRLALLLTLTISMIPVVADFARRVRDAQQARGVRLGVRFIVPLLVISLRHADQVGDALDARGIG